MPLYQANQAARQAQYLYAGTMWPQQSYLATSHIAHMHNAPGTHMSPSPSPTCNTTGNQNCTALPGKQLTSGALQAAACSTAHISAVALLQSPSKACLHLLVILPPSTHAPSAVPAPGTIAIAAPPRHRIIWHSTTSNQACQSKQASICMHVS